MLSKYFKFEKFDNSSSYNFTVARDRDIDMKNQGSIRPQLQDKEKVYDRRRDSWFPWEYDTSYHCHRSHSIHLLDLRQVSAYVGVYKPVIFPYVW